MARWTGAIIRASRGFHEFVGFQGGWNPFYRYRLDRNGRIEYGDKRPAT